MRWHESRRLSGPRIRLRPIKNSDFAAWRDVRERGRDWLEPWEPLPEPGAPDPVSDHEAFKVRCSTWERQWHFDNAYGFGLFLHDGTFVGEVSIGSVQRGPFQSGYLGYWIDEQYAGRGLVPEGVVLLMRFGFEELRMHRLEAAIVPRNKASRAVAEKLEMREEGIAVRFLQIRGEWEDHVRYAMTSEEWLEKRQLLAEKFLSRG